MASCRTYIQKITDDEKVQDKLTSYHNEIFAKIKDSKLFRTYQEHTFLPNANASGRYNKAKAFLNQLNKEYGVPVVGTAFTKATGREYVFVNVRNLLSKAQGSTQGTLFNVGQPSVTEANPLTLTKFKEFARRSGLTGVYTDKIVVNSERISPQGVANLAKGLYEVIKGKESLVEPEEIMHFAVAGLKETNPELYRKMLGSVDQYAIYRQALSDYSDVYKTEDGKPDILKIKDEAIAKVLADTVIRKEQGLDTPAKIEQAKTWWEQIKQWFLKLIGKAGFNPFEEAANVLDNTTKVTGGEEAKALVDRVMEKLKGGFKTGFEALYSEGRYSWMLSEIYEQLTGAGTYKPTIDQMLGGDENLAQDIISYFKGQEFYQVDSQERDKVYDALKVADSKISKVTVKDEAGQDKEVYMVGGKEVKNRVTDKVKRFYDRLFRDKEITSTEYRKSVDDIKRQYGTAGHHDLEHAFHDLIDENGFVKANPVNAEYTPETSKDVYNILYRNLRDRINTYPAGTRFLSEIKIYDASEDKAGTIDFLAIRPNGKIDILDWKFYDLNTSVYSDVQWYKKKAWRMQVSDYKKILEDIYNVEPSKFQQTMAIPIKTVYDQKKGSDNKFYPVLSSIEIGTTNIKNETRDYLLPVSLESQATGDDKLDTLLRKLSGLRERLEKREVGTPQEKFNKAEQLNALEKVIRHLQIKQSLEPLITQAGTFNKDIHALIDEYKNLKEEDWNEYAMRLSKASEDIEIYTNLSNELGHVVKDNKELKSKLQEATIRAQELEVSLWDTMKDFGEKIANSDAGIHGIMDPEVVVSWNRRMFKETSKIPTKNMQVLYEERRDAQNKMDMATSEENADLKRLEHEYETLAKSAGLNKRNYFKFIKKEGKNELIDQYQKEFYKQARQAVKEKNFEWAKNNIKLKEYQEHIKGELENKIALVNNQHIEEDEKLRRITQLKNEYDTSKIDSYGWFLHYGTLIKYPKEGLWESEDWKTLNKPENKAALDLYNWVKKINEKADNFGYLPQGKPARTFLPYAPKSLMEAVQSGGKIGLYDRFMRGITIDEDTLGRGAIDSVTGQVINRIPKYFINETDKELSDDLIRNLAKYNEFLNQFIYLKDIEGKVSLLGKLERNKGSIITFHGKPKFNREENRFETIETNEKNADLYDRHVASIIYGQKYVAEGKIDQMIGDAGVIARKVNKFLGKKILPEDYTGKQISFAKGIDAANSFFQFKTLGLSVLPAASNYIGGHLQLGILAGKYFGKREVMSAEMQFMAAATTGEQGKKLMAAVNYFVPFTRDKNRDTLKEVSIYKLDDQSIQDFLMSFMRWGDKLVEGMTFTALWNNAILVDGKIYNAREYVRNLPENVGRYDSPESFRKYENDFYKKVDEVKEQYSLAKQSKIVNDQLVIPGIDRNSETVYTLRDEARALAKRVIGNMSPDEIRGVSQSVITNSMMIFKNWIPALADVRFAKLQYNRDIDAYEWGRARTIMRFLARDGLFKGINNMIAAVKVTEKGLQGLNDLYEFKKKQHYEQTGQKLDITKNEFYDMVRANISNSTKDLLITLSMLGAWFTLANIFPPADDEDPGVKNWHKFMVRALDKFKDEVNFYYDPLTFQNIIGGSIFPSIGLFKDFANIFNHFLKEVYGMEFDENLEEKNYVVKYLMKGFPVTSQLSTLLPLFLPDLAKEFGIQPTTQARILQ